MKLQSDARLTAMAISACGPGHVTVGGRRITKSCLVHPNGIDESWGPETFDALDTNHFAALAATACDVMLLGTGSRQRFPSPHLLKPAIEAGVAVEVMDTAAACRTYNIVLAEGRTVAAGLIVE